MIGTIERGELRRVSGEGKGVYVQVYLGVSERY
jgi:hypothetical protein